MEGLLLPSTPQEWKMWWITYADQFDTRVQRALYAPACAHQDGVEFKYMRRSGVGADNMYSLLIPSSELNHGDAGLLRRLIQAPAEDVETNAVSWDTIKHQLIPSEDEWFAQAVPDVTVAWMMLDLYIHHPTVLTILLQGRMVEGQLEERVRKLIHGLPSRNEQLLLKMLFTHAFPDVGLFDKDEFHVNVLSPDGDVDETLLDQLQAYLQEDNGIYQAMEDADARASVSAFVSSTQSMPFSTAFHGKLKELQSFDVVMQEGATQDYPQVQRHWAWLQQLHQTGGIVKDEEDTQDGEQTPSARSHPFPLAKSFSSWFREWRNIQGDASEAMQRMWTDGAIHTRMGHWAEQRKSMEQWYAWGPRGQEILRPALEQMAQKQEATPSVQQLQAMANMECSVQEREANEAHAWMKSSSWNVVTAGWMRYWNSLHHILYTPDAPKLNSTFLMQKVVDWMVMAKEAQASQRQLFPKFETFLFPLAHMLNEQDQPMNETRTWSSLRAHAFLVGWMADPRAAAQHLSLYMCPTASLNSLWTHILAAHDTVIHEAVPTSDVLAEHILPFAERVHAMKHTTDVVPDILSLPQWRESFKTLDEECPQYMEPIIMDEETTEAQHSMAVITLYWMQAWTMWMRVDMTAQIQRLFSSYGVLENATSGSLAAERTDKKAQKDVPRQLRVSSLFVQRMRRLFEDMQKFIDPANYAEVTPKRVLEELHPTSMSMNNLSEDMKVTAAKLQMWLRASYVDLSSWDDQTTNWEELRAMAETGTSGNTAYVWNTSVFDPRVYALMGVGCDLKWLENMADLWDRFMPDVELYLRERPVDTTLEKKKEDEGVGGFTWGGDGGEEEEEEDETGSQAIASADTSIVDRATRKLATDQYAMANTLLDSMIKFTLNQDMHRVIAMYGASGTGKTYTTLGRLTEDQREWGALPQLLRKLVEQEDIDNTTVKLSVCMLMHNDEASRRLAAEEEWVNRDRARLMQLNIQRMWDLALQLYMLDEEEDTRTEKVMNIIEQIQGNIKDAYDAWIKGYSDEEEEWSRAMWSPVHDKSPMATAQLFRVKGLMERAAEREAELAKKAAEMGKNVVGAAQGFFAGAVRLVSGSKDEPAEDLGEEQEEEKEVPESVILIHTLKWFMQLVQLSQWAMYTLQPTQLNPSGSSRAHTLYRVEWETANLTSAGSEKRKRVVTFVDMAGMESPLLIREQWPEALRAALGDRVPLFTVRNMKNLESDLTFVDSGVREEKDAVTQAFLRGQFKQQQERSMATSSKTTHAWKEFMMDKTIQGMKMSLTPLLNLAQSARDGSDTWIDTFVQNQLYKTVAWNGSSVENLAKEGDEYTLSLFEAQPWRMLQLMQMNQSVWIVHTLVHMRAYLGHVMLHRKVNQFKDPQSKEALQYQPLREQEGLCAEEDRDFIDRKPWGCTGWNVASPTSGPAFNAGMKGIADQLDIRVYDAQSNKRVAKLWTRMSDTVSSSTTKTEKDDDTVVLHTNGGGEGEGEDSDATDSEGEGGGGDEVDDDETDNEEVVPLTASPGKSATPKKELWPLGEAEEEAKVEKEQAEPSPPHTRSGKGYGRPQTPAAKEPAKEQVARAAPASRGRRRRRGGRGRRGRRGKGSSAKSTASADVATVDSKTWDVIPWTAETEKTPIQPYPWMDKTNQLYTWNISDDTRTWSLPEAIEAMAPGLKPKYSIVFTKKAETETSKDAEGQATVALLQTLDSFLHNVIASAAAPESEEDA